MQLLTPLISGFADAPGGYAVIYQRGTSTRATCYTDFNGTLSTKVHTLDSNGRLARWVNEIVDVNVFDAAGNAVISFTFAEGAPAVEVRHSHWTGTDYDTGQAALGKPLTLQALLDTLFTSFGADDGKVLLSGAQVALQTAIGSLALSNIYDVKTRNGALGDGLQDDQARIQAAIAAAAAAGGGTVYLPPGDFRITSALDFSIANGEKVALIGAGPGVTFLAMDHGTNSWINVANAGPTTGFQTIAGIRFRAIQANSGSNLIDTVGNWKRYRMVNCHFGETSGSQVRMQTSNDLIFEDCLFTMAGGANNNSLHSVGATGSGPISVRNCRWIGFAGAHTPTNGIIYAPFVMVRDCRFNFSATTGGTGIVIDSRALKGSSVLNSRFNCGSATWTAMNPGVMPGSAPLTTPGSDEFIEDGNIFDGSEIPFTGWSTTFGNYHLGSRLSRTQQFSVVSFPTPLDIDLRTAAHCIVYADAGGPGTLTVSPGAANGDCPNGSMWWLTVRNASGGTVTVAFNALFKVAAINPTNGNDASYAFQMRRGIWTQVGASVIAV